MATRRLFDAAIFDTNIFDTHIRVHVVPPPAPTLESVLRGPHAPVSRLEILDADLVTTLYSLDGQLVEGSVTTDRTADTYGSGSITFVANDPLLRMVDQSSLIWTNRPVRISRGAIVGTGPVLVPLITGVIVDPQDELESGRVSFSVASRFILAKRKFPGPTTIPAGRLGDAIRMLLEIGGLGTSDGLYDFDDEGRTVDARTFDSNVEVLGSAVKWAFDQGCDLWPSGVGVATLRPFVDPAAVTPRWTFDEGQYALLTRLSRQLRAPNQVNRQVVQGRSPDGYTVEAQAVISDPGNPLYWRPDFDLPGDVYFSADITDVATAQEVADRLLLEKSGYEETLTVEAIPVPLVAARDVVAFAGTGLVDDNYLLTNVAVPVGKGAMRLTTRRVRSLV